MYIIINYLQCRQRSRRQSPCSSAGFLSVRYSPDPGHPLSAGLSFSSPDGPGRRYILALLSLVQLPHYCTVIGLESALSCHKEPAQGTQSPLLEEFPLFPCVFTASARFQSWTPTGQLWPAGVRLTLSEFQLFRLSTTSSPWTSS